MCRLALYKNIIHIKACSCILTVRLCSHTGTQIQSDGCLTTQHTLWYTKEKSTKESSRINYKSVDIRWSSNSHEVRRGGFPGSLEIPNQVTGLRGKMWHDINPVAQYTSTTANRQHQHTMQDDLLIQHSLLGDPSSYLLLYSCGHKPSEGCKTSQNPLCRLAKIQPNRTFQRKEESRSRAQKREEKKRRVSQTLIRGRTGWEEGRRDKHFSKQSI